MEITELHRQIGLASMIYVTHDQVEAMTLADKIVLFTPGAGARREPGIAQVGSPLTLYHHPANRFVAGVLAPGAERVLLAFVDGRGLQPAKAPRWASAPSTCWCSAKAPALPTKAGPPWSSTSNTWGNTAPCTPSCETATLIAKVHDENFRVGDALRLVAPPEAVHLFREDGAALPRRLFATAASV